MRLDSSMNKRPPGGWRISMKHGFLQKLSGSTVQLLIYQHGFVIFCNEIRVQLWKLNFIIHFRRIFQYKPSSYLVYPHDYGTLEIPEDFPAMNSDGFTKNPSNESNDLDDNLGTVPGWWFATMEFYDIPYIGKNHPNWRTPSFFRGV